MYTVTLNAAALSIAYTALLEKQAWYQQFPENFRAREIVQEIDEALSALRAAIRRD